MRSSAIGGTESGASGFNGGQYLSSRFHGQVNNSDLLKKYQEDLERMEVSLEKIQLVLKSPNID